VHVFKYLIKLVILYYYLVYKNVKSQYILIFHGINFIIFKMRNKEFSSIANIRGYSSVSRHSYHPKQKLFF